MNRKGYLKKMVDCTKVLFIFWTGMLMLAWGFVIYPILRSEANEASACITLVTIAIWSAVVFSKGIKILKAV